MYLKQITGLKEPIIAFYKLYKPGCMFRLIVSVAIAIVGSLPILGITYHGLSKIENVTKKDEKKIETHIDIELQPKKQQYTDNNKINTLYGWIRTKRQGVQLARMGVNEDSRAINPEPYGSSGELTEDHKMIASTVVERRNRKKYFDGWLDVMRFTSPHVGRIKVSKRHRHEWTSMLPATKNSLPKNWIDCRYNKSNCDGDWRVHGKYWVKFRKNMIDYWMNTDFKKKHEIHGYKPVMWGNTQDVIRFLKRYEKMCVLNTDTKNFFLANNGNGCSINDDVTIAARSGKKLYID